jgi:hypothetical protein
LLLRGYAILFVAALALDFPAAAIGVALVGLANLASILLQTAQLGRILTPVLERIGRSLNLTPAQNA